MVIHYRSFKKKTFVSDERYNSLEMVMILSLILLKIHYINLIILLQVTEDSTLTFIAKLQLLIHNNRNKYSYYIYNI